MDFNSILSIFFYLCGRYSAAFFEIHNSMVENSKLSKSSLVSWYTKFKFYGVHLCIKREYRQHSRTV